MDDHRNPSPPHRRAGAEEDGGGGRVTCTGKSCAARAIGDCVALCCCPCAVVNCFVLAFVKLPWAVARRRLRRSRRRVEVERKCDEGMLEIEAAGECVSAEELWIELAEIGHLGFGRISSAGINYYKKGN
ncbi:hypothetical protein SASPL_142077 [Salvia splendens]|uniref:Uncharacterized protein n=1 Tax=Salvia splendens TaxID=180675 RepID=A0A8X8WKR5_SALSN|nr:uncharacterized protein LOC121771940 [Salvia splendens]XP_042043108.1 uncharacterized protein LOC121788520 [Salvia splendens]KAG6382524.1 hypothetical protein SASPL_157808 [Salvia splendens]KAG6395943.1 hypothetical protein SASPL_142077 [Salvia splendens]